MDNSFFVFFFQSCAVSSSSFRSKPETKAPRVGEAKCCLHGCKLYAPHQARLKKAIHPVPSPQLQTPGTSAQALWLRLIRNCFILSQHSTGASNCRLPEVLTEKMTQKLSAQSSHVLTLASSGCNGGPGSKGPEMSSIFCTVWGVGGISLLPTQSGHPWKRSSMTLHHRNLPSVL